MQASTQLVRSDNCATGILLGVVPIRTGTTNTRFLLNGNFRASAKSQARNSGLGFQWIAQGNSGSPIGVLVYGPVWDINGQVKGFLRMVGQTHGQTVALRRIDPNGSWEMISLERKDRQRPHDVGAFPLEKLDTLVSLILSQSPGESDMKRASPPTKDLTIVSIDAIEVRDEPGWLERWRISLRERQSGKAICDEGHHLR